jgi:hypothetical protein
MDVKRGREEEEEQQEDEKALRPYLAILFDKLPPLALAQIILDGGLTIAQMHALCTANQNFARICHTAAVWKRVFIERFVRQRGDKRNSSRFEQWADEPLVQRWDSCVAMEPTLRGFTHLVAESLIFPFSQGLNWLELPLRFSMDAIQVRLYRYRDDADAFTGKISYSFAFSNDVDIHRQLAKEMAGDYGLHIEKRALWTILAPPEESVLAICKWLERGLPRRIIKPLIQSCIRCASPATMQCKHCSDMYCSAECAQKIVGE